MNPSLIGLLVFLALASALGTVVLAVHDVVSARRARLAAHAAAARPVRLRRRKKPDDASPRGLTSAFDRWFLRLVHETGLSWDPVAASLLMVLSGILVGAALFLWNEQPLPVVLGMLLGAALPLGYLVVRRRRRIRCLQDLLAPALEILARAVRAGQTLDQAMALLGEHSPEPLAAEFRYCSKQLEMGLGMPAVMRSLVERVQLYDVRIFATSLVVHRETGGNIAAVLDRLAFVVRDRLSYRRQLQVATAGGRISAGLVSLIAPSLFVFFFFFRPHYINTLIQSPLGQSLLLTAVFLEIVGLIWTWRLLKPAY